MVLKSMHVMCMYWGSGKDTSGFENLKFLLLFTRVLNGHQCNYKMHAAVKAMYGRHTARSVFYLESFDSCVQFIVILVPIQNWSNKQQQFQILKFWSILATSSVHAHHMHALQNHSYGCLDEVLWCERQSKVAHCNLVNCQSGWFDSQFYSVWYIHCGGNTTTLGP